MCDLGVYRAEFYTFDFMYKFRSVNVMCISIDAREYYIHKTLSHLQIAWAVYVQNTIQWNIFTALLTLSCIWSVWMTILRISISLILLNITLHHLPFVSASFSNKLIPMLYIKKTKHT